MLSPFNMHPRTASKLSILASGAWDNKPIDYNNDDDGDLTTYDGESTDHFTQHHQIKKYNISLLPEKNLLTIFSYLTLQELLRCSLVCRQWRSLSQNSRLWKRVYLRPEYNGLHISNVNKFITMISKRFSLALQYIDLPIELITIDILHELANKCPNLNRLTLDFSTAMQLHDFNELNIFPCNLKMLCICLSDVIFLEGFMRKIYSFLSSLETLHIIGTIEKSTDPEEEIYETINISKIKLHTPNLRVINLYGIYFIDDYHIEAIASGCIHLECLALNFCTRIKGTSFVNVIQRCRKLKCLLLQNTGIEDSPMCSVAWESSYLSELDISSTELTEECLLDIFFRMPKLNYLAVPNCDGFTDKVLEILIHHGKLSTCRAIDLSNTVNLDYEIVFTFLTKHGRHLQGIAYAGAANVTEEFWRNIIKSLKNIKIMIMGSPYGMFKKITTKVHVDQILDACAQYCSKLERLEIQWDPDTVRYSDYSSKFIDHLRTRCTYLQSLVLSDGAYYEVVKANFERAERNTVVRTTTMYRTSNVSLLHYYNELRFN